MTNPTPFRPTHRALDGGYPVQVLDRSAGHVTFRIAAAAARLFRLDAATFDREHVAVEEARWRPADEPDEPAEREPDGAITRYVAGLKAEAEAARLNAAGGAEPGGATGGAPGGGRGGAGGPEGGGTPCDLTPTDQRPSLARANSSKLGGGGDGAPS